MAPLLAFVPVFANTIGQIFQPLYHAMAAVLAFFYALIPNYAVAITLLTVTVMIVTAPLTIKSTRSQIAMQKVAPELKKLQQKYKGDRVKLNEEMMRLYRENNVSPAGGCLPLLVQMPVFLILYGVIRGLTNTVIVHGRTVAAPRYISPHTDLYKSLVRSHGQMNALGINLADSLFSHHSSLLAAVPFALLIIAAIALQYLQMRQINNRNPGALDANPQMKMMQRYLPLVFGLIYLKISAAVNIYFIVSSICRIGIQEMIFRTGLAQGRAGKVDEQTLPAPEGAALKPRRRSMMERLADMQKAALAQQDAQRQARQQPPGRPQSESSPGASSSTTGDQPPARSGNGARTGSPNGAAERGGAGETGDTTAKPTGAKKPVGGAKPSSSGKSASPGGPARANGAQGASANGATGGDGAPGAKAPHPRSRAKRPRRGR